MFVYPYPKRSLRKKKTMAPPCGYYGEVSIRKTRGSIEPQQVDSYKLQVANVVLGWIWPGAQTRNYDYIFLSSGIFGVALQQHFHSITCFNHLCSPLTCDH